jgi:hypothetical protein
MTMPTEKTRESNDMTTRPNQRGAPLPTHSSPSNCDIHTIRTRIQQSIWRAFALTVRNAWAYSEYSRLLPKSDVPPTDRVETGH